MANYQTGGYKFRPTIAWNGRIELRTSRSFMNSTDNKIHSSVTSDDQSPRHRLTQVLNSK